MTEQLMLIPDSPPKSKIRKVLLSSLPANQDLYCPAPPSGMTESMRRLGQLQAIGVIEIPGGGYTVCWGRKRIKSARHLGWLSIEAKVYSPELSAGHLLTLVENEQRRESLAVQIEAVEATRKRLPEADICRLVGISKSSLKQIVALIDGLIPEMREALKEGRIAQGTAAKALRLTPEQQAQLAKLDKIRSADVEDLLLAKMSAFVSQLPQTLFEPPAPANWQVQLEQKLTEVSQIVPLERSDILEALANLKACLHLD